MGGKTRLELLRIQNAIAEDPALGEAIVDVVTGPSTRLSAAVASATSYRPQLLLSTRESGALLVAETLGIGTLSYVTGTIAFHGNRLVTALLYSVPAIEETAEKMLRALREAGLIED